MFSIVPPAMFRRRPRVRLVSKADKGRPFNPFTFADLLLILALVWLAIGAAAFARVLS